MIVGSETNLVWLGEAGARNPAGSALRKAQRKRAQPIPPTARRGQLQGQSNSPQGGSQTSHASSNRASLQQWRGRPHSSGKSSSLTRPQKGHAQHPYAEAAERFAVPSLTRSQDHSPRTTPTTRKTPEAVTVFASRTRRQRGTVTFSRIYAKTAAPDEPQLPGRCLRKWQ